MTPNIFNVGILIKVNSNMLTHYCKIPQARHGKIEVEYVNCPSKQDFWLDESNPNISKHKYMLRSMSQVVSTSTQQSNSKETNQIQDRAPISIGIQHEHSSNIAITTIPTTSPSTVIPSTLILDLVLATMLAVCSVVSICIV